MARKKGAAGGHGAGWFVTFADLMALLMSFFVMLAAMSTQDQKKLQVVAGSMRDAFGVQATSRNAGIIEVDGLPFRPKLKNAEHIRPEDASDITAPTELASKLDGMEIVMADRRFALAVTTLRQALGEMPEIAELSKNIIIQQTREGLNLEIVDQDGRAMFAEGSREPLPRTRRLLEALGPALRKLPNRLKIAGHTATLRGKAGADAVKSAWQLSTERALAVRDLLAGTGIGDDRFHSVVGRADTEPLFPDDPTVAANRRITILLMREEPPLPRGAKP